MGARVGVGVRVRVKVSGLTVWVLTAGEVARSLEETEGTWSTSMMTSGAAGAARCALVERVLRGDTAVGGGGGGEHIRMTDVLVIFSLSSDS